MIDWNRSDVQQAVYDLTLHANTFAHLIDAHSARREYAQAAACERKLAAIGRAFGLTVDDAYVDVGTAWGIVDDIESAIRGEVWA